MGGLDRVRRGVTAIGGAAALVGIAREVWPMVKPAVEQGRDNAAAWRRARAHAGRVVEGSYLDVYDRGRKHWVVWSRDEPLAAYPPVEGELAPVVARVDLVRRRRPGERRRPKRTAPVA